MKRLLILLCVLAACRQHIDTRILGTWETKSKYYEARYEIAQRGSKLIGKLLYYNDNIKVLHATHSDKDIVFKNIKSKNDVYVDAISGATVTGNKNIAFKIKNEDTLEVTRYIMNKPLAEYWTRKK